MSEKDFFPISKSQRGEHQNVGTRAKSRSLSSKEYSTSMRSLVASQEDVGLEEEEARLDDTGVPRRLTEIPMPMKRVEMQDPSPTA